MTKTTTKKQDYDLQDDLNKIKSALAGVTNGVKQNAQELFSESLSSLKDTTDNVKDSVAEYTSAKPFKSIAFALLAGVLLGKLIF